MKIFKGIFKGKILKSEEKNSGKRKKTKTKASVIDIQNEKKWREKKKEKKTKNSRKPRTQNEMKHVRGEEGSEVVRPN